MESSHVRPRSAFPDTGRYPRSHTPITPETARAPQGTESLAKALGWFSIGLGVASLAAPRTVARLIGIRGDDTDATILRVVGLQELACGLGILGTRHPAGWLWARVAGDAAHVTLTSGALLSGTADPGRMAATVASLAGIGAIDAYAAARLTAETGSEGSSHMGGPVEIHETITISRPAEELYRFWRDFQNLPRIMSHLESVEVNGEGRSHWRAKSPFFGKTVEWDAEVTEDRPNERIAWQSVGGQVDTSGSVRFVPAPGGRGTEVHVVMRYELPGGELGRWAAKLFGGSPEQQVFDDLRHFKQVMETGEVVLSGSSGDGSRVLQRPAQPPETTAPGR